MNELTPESKHYKEANENFRNGKCNIQDKNSFIWLNCRFETTKQRDSNKFEGMKIETIL